MVTDSGPDSALFAPVIYSVHSADLSITIFDFYQPLSELRMMIPKPSMALACFIPSMYMHIFTRNYTEFQLWLFPGLLKAG